MQEYGKRNHFTNRTEKSMGFTTFDEPVTVREALETIQGDFLVEK